MSENSGIPTDKAGLRAWARENRAHSNPALASAKIVAQIKRLPEFVAARHILLYLALPHEVDIEPLALASGMRQKTWYAPRCAPRKQLMIHEFDPALTVMTAGIFGIREPDAAHATPLVDPQVLDLIFVPGLLYSRNRERLGNGGGYYDRFLPNLRSNCVLAGIAASTQIVETLPMDPWDINVDLVVTDSDIIR